MILKGLLPVNKMPDQVPTARSTAADVPLAPLSDDERMLVIVRDELYDGSWRDFEQDLRDRLGGLPHVYDIGPPSPRLRDTIEAHLALIRELLTLERNYGIDLRQYVDLDR